MDDNDLNLDAYPLTIRPLADEESDGRGGYWIEFPDLPYCASEGLTPEEAIVNGREALKAVILTMKEFGRPIPKPGSAGKVPGPPL